MTATRSIELEPPDGPAAAERLHSVEWPLWEALALAGILAVSLVLRFHDYTLAPLFTDNLDELQFTWLGLNLIEHGDAYTWSFFSGYPAYIPYHAFGVDVPMVHHWMDHPPLFAYIMGGWAWLLGDRGMLDVTAEQVRILPILWSSLAVGLVYLLGRQLLGRGPALIGAGLLATSPAAVLMARQVEPESLQAVLLVAALLCTLRVVNREPSWWAVGLLLLCCAAAPFMKVSGVAIAGICLVILFVSRRWRLAATTAGAGLLGLLLYVAYGLIVDWQLFIHIFSLQSANRLGIMSAFDFIADPTGINRRLRDGWWIFGWVGIGALLFAFQGGRDRRRELFLAWPAVAYAATMMVLAGEKQIQQYGWYKVIIYPELYLAAGFLAWNAVRHASLAGLTLLLVLGGATATNWWLGGFDQNWVPNPVLLVVLVLAVIGPAIWALLRREDYRARQMAVQVAAVTLALLAAGNAVESLALPAILGRM